MARVNGSGAQMDMENHLASRKAKAKVKAADIRAAMAKRWRDPEWAIMWEVGEGTGARGGRYADAVMMSLWPSRGLELHGVEIKISRADWKREAADPRKAEAIAQYCDRWWVHTAPGVVDDLSDLPPAWGLREWDGRCWRTIREADKTAAIPVTRDFLAALLRRADGTMRLLMDEAMREARNAQLDEFAKQQAQFQERVTEAVERRTAKLSKAAENVAAFEAVFGEGIASSWACRPEAWGRAAKALAECGDRGYGPLAKRFRETADAIDALQAVIGVDAEAEDLL